MNEEGRWRKPNFCFRSGLAGTTHQEQDPGRRPDRPSKGCEIDKEMYRPWTLLTQARDLKISKEWAPPQRF